MVGFQGNFELFAKAFPDDLVPSVFRMMLKEWPHAPRPVADPLENRITNRFVGHLQKVMRTYDQPLFEFSYRHKLPDPNADSERAEVDISVRSFLPPSKGFLAIECKRLNVQKNDGFHSLAGKYVGEGGMGCFISEQYQSGGNVGGMLGYVMTRTIDSAMNSINGQLASHREELQLIAPYKLRESGIVPNEANIKQTTHALSDADFEIIHLLVQF